MFISMDALDTLSFTGTKADGWYLEEAKDCLLYTSSIKKQRETNEGVPLGGMPSFLRGGKGKRFSLSDRDAQERWRTL